jgi:hypothetical protein
MHSKRITFCETRSFEKSEKACESGEFSAEYDNLGFNSDTKAGTKILLDFV